MGGYETAADGTVTQSLTPYMSLGYELFSYNNRVQNKIATVTDNFTYYAGLHKITAGFSFEHQLANNAYMRGGTGYYRYRSLDDFLNGAAPETVGLAYGYNGETNPNAEVVFNQYGLYAQDEWNILENLKLTGGIRFDMISFNDDDLMRNNAIYDLDFGGRHIDTGAWPDGNVQISPRIGFTWDVFGDKSLKVRGGTGLFAGRLPLVFFTNMPTNSGMVQNLVHADTNYSNGVVVKSDPRLQNFAGGLVTDVNKIRELLGAPESISPDEGTVPSEIAGVDKNFKMPQVWKSSLAVDYQFPVAFPLTLTGEFTYTKNVNAVILDNYNIKPIDSSWEQLKGEQLQQRLRADQHPQGLRLDHEPDGYRRTGEGPAPDGRLYPHGDEGNVRHAGQQRLFGLVGTLLGERPEQRGAAELALRHPRPRHRFRQLHLS